MSNNIFDDKNAVKSNWVKWGKTGDSITGTLISKREVDNNLPGKEGTKQTVYEIKVSEGEFHDILEDKSISKEITKLKKGEVWSIGGKAGIEAQMRNVKIGQIIGMKFAESIPSKTKGFNPTKIIKVFTAGEMDSSVMEGVGQEVDADDIDI